MVLFFGVLFFWPSSRTIPDQSYSRLAFYFDHDAKLRAIRGKAGGEEGSSCVARMQHACLSP